MKAEGDTIVDKSTHREIHPLMCPLRLKNLCRRQGYSDRVAAVDIVIAVGENTCREEPDLKFGKAYIEKTGQAFK